MDKVIIDGVDVSECSYAITPKIHAPAKYNMPYAKETSCIACKEDITRLNFCKNNPNCYYKQLKRLQAENERMKEELRTEKIYSSQIEELEGSLQHAKAENEELSESIKRLKNMAKAAALGREKYKQALQEIREMDTLFHSVNENKGLDRFKNNIIAKINEVIGAE